MRGSDERTGSLFSYVDLEARVRKDHPLRTIRLMVNETLAAMEGDFAALYSGLGRPSIAPEKLLRAMLLQAFYAVRSERLLMERLEFDLLFRWFVGLGVDEAVWDHSTFSKNRDRLLEGAVAARFLSTLMAQPKVKRLLSTDHFSVDGTLVQAWAKLARGHAKRSLVGWTAEGSMKSCRPVDSPAGSGPDDPPPPSGGRNVETNFRGETRSNATHASTTDPEAKLYRKGPGMEAKLAFLGHALMENRCGRSLPEAPLSRAEWSGRRRVLVDACLTPANGHAERVAALAMIEPRADRPVAVTLGADKGYDAADFVNELRSMNVRPHIAQNTTRHRGRSAIDKRTTRHAGYIASQRIRKRIEEAFGWMKSVGGMRRPMLRGTDRVGWAFTFAAAAYNLVRLPKLIETAA